jgi:feruloyl esterase
MLAHHRREISVIAFVIATVAATPALGSGNLHSFSRAQDAKIDFRATSIRAAHDCKSFLSETAGGLRVTTAELVAAKDGVPEHCRINGVIPQEVGFQLNFPIAWNGRLYMYGNGGYAGEDAESPREQDSRNIALRDGFATARTDTGHLASKEPLGTFAVNHAKVVDHGYRAVHETVTLAKQLASAFYGSGPNFSYWDGCSTGGRQGVMAAQRYPKDFDGIVATAPTLKWTDIMVKGLWNQRALERGGFTPGKMQTVFSAFTAKCDASDGAGDGLVGDPRQCKFTPASDVKRCEAGQDANDCLTAQQAQALQDIYDGPKDRSGKPIFVGQVPGAEELSVLAPFVIMQDGSANALTRYADSWMKYLAFEDANYDSKTFDFDKDPQRIRKMDQIFNPTADLAPFRDAGGKMITFWGWADNALNPQMGMQYYDEVVGKLGLANTQSFYRFFLVPGFAHCRGGYGPNEVDAMSVIIDWVEGGIAPQRLPARMTGKDGKVRYQRAYCAYPQMTKYSGSGDTEDPKNYVCE